MKIAAIDIGSNSILLLVAQVTASGEILPLRHEVATTRLNQTDPDYPELLAPTAVENSLKVLQNYLNLCHHEQTEKILIAATYPFRLKKNGGDFCEQVESESGTRVQILNSVEEAELSYLGAISNKPELSGKILVIDLGGGSTELALGQGKQLLQTVSLSLGSVRLTEKFIRNDPPLPAEVSQMRQAIQIRLRHLSAGQFACEHFIGVAGTITTLAAIKHGLSLYRPDGIDGSRLHLSEINAIYDDLIRKTNPARQQIIGMEPERADILIAGTVLLQELLQWLRHDALIVSDRCLRYGLIVKELEKFKGEG